MESRQKLPRALNLAVGQVFSGFIVEVTEAPSEYHVGPDAVLIVEDLDGQHSLYCGTKRLRRFVETEQPASGDLLSIRYDGETFLPHGKTRKEYTIQLMRADD